MLVVRQDQDRSPQAVGLGIQDDEAGRHVPHQPVHPRIDSIHRQQTGLGAIQSGAAHRPPRTWW